MKTIKWAALVVLAIIIVGGIVLYASINGIIRSTVETQASESLNLQTSLGAARLSILGGALSLSDLQIASPQGYAAPRMFMLGGVNVGVRLGELRQEPIRIATVTIDRPRLVVEREGGKFNLQAAMDQMPPTDPAEEPFRLIIGDLQVRDAVVVLRPGLPGLAEEITVSIPPISIENVGTGEGADNGVAIREVVMQVATAMAAKAAESDQLPDQLRALLNIDMEQLAARLDAEFTRQFQQLSEEIRAQLPEDVGQLVEEALRDPAALERERERIEQQIEQRIERLPLPLPAPRRDDREAPPAPPTD